MYKITNKELSYKNHIKILDGEKQTPRWTSGIYRRQNIKVRERNMKKEIVEEDKKRETK